MSKVGDIKMHLFIKIAKGHADTTPQNLFNVKKYN